MTDTGEQPVAGSLYAVVIRACQAHGPNCKKHRKIEDLGEIASFGLPSPVAAEQEAKTDLMSRVKRLFGRE